MLPLSQDLNLCPAALAKNGARFELQGSSLRVTMASSGGASLELLFELFLQKELEKAPFGARAPFYFPSAVSVLGPKPQRAPCLKFQNQKMTKSCLELVCVCQFYPQFPASAPLCAAGFLSYPAGALIALLIGSLRPEIGRGFSEVFTPQPI